MRVDISITYCAVCRYTPLAVSLTTELLQSFEADIERISLFPSSGGVFDVVINGELLFSKKLTGRQAEPGEVKALLQNFLEERSS